MSETNMLRVKVSKTVEMIAAGYAGENGIDHIFNSVIEALPKISSKSTNHDEGSSYRRYLEGQEDYQESITAILEAAKEET